MKSLKLVMVGILSLVALCSPLSWAQSVPSLINYHGRLTDATGVPLSAGTYGVAFRLWNKQALESGQQLIWGREYEVTMVEGGAFSIILGSGGRGLSNGNSPAVNDLAFAFGEATRFLGLTIIRHASGQAISNPNELMPRQQILSAPFAFKAEEAATLVPTFANTLCPPASIVAYAGASPPTGWLACNGQGVSRSTYSRLFGAIGTTFGTGDGSQTFNLPDLRGRVAMGAGQGSGLTSRAIGQSIGGEAHTLTVAEMPSHTHQLVSVPGYDAGGGWSGGGWWGDPFTQTTSATGGNAPHNIVQPSLVVNYIIKY